MNAIVDEAHAFHKVAAVHCFTPQGQRMRSKPAPTPSSNMGVLRAETTDRIAEAGVWIRRRCSTAPTARIQTRKDQGTSQFVVDKMKQIQPDCFRTFQRMSKAGVNIAMGTDMGYDPEMGTNARELEIYVDLGMKPMDAILTSTRNAARALKLDQELGTLEPGKLADLIAVDGDPLKNIRCLQEKKNIKIVMKEGRIYADRRPGKNRNVVNVKPGEWKIIDYL